MKATITKIIVETPRVLTFVVEMSEPVSFKTGQAMRWNVPGVTLGRLYSVASPGGEDIRELWFTIRIVEDGRFTPHLRSLKEGDVIDVSGPFGKFIVAADDPLDIGLIAGGSGISVMRSIIHSALASNPKRRVHLVFSVLNVHEIIYREELEKLAQADNAFSYTIVVTEPDPSWKGHSGYVTKEIFDKEFKDYKERFYLCGPQPFIECAKGLLHDAGVSDDRIHIDQWTFYAPKLMK